MRDAVPFLPDIEAVQLPPDAPFMLYSTCSTKDFYHPEFIRLSRMVGHSVPFYHRKLWEWVYILHHAHESGIVGHGKRALVFGVGSEHTVSPLAQAGMLITATDAPEDIGVVGWTPGNQFSQSVANIPSLGMDRLSFERQVTFQTCDMNNIDPSLNEFDLCWSSCALEHLGSLQHGIDFIINSVEKTLKPGGVAIHTTEFNLSSNQETVEVGGCVLYRRRDLDQLICELRSRGHEVQDFKVAPDSTVIDGYVDRPPYLQKPHIKLEIDGFVTTSAGIVIRRCSIG